MEEVHCENENGARPTKHNPELFEFRMQLKPIDRTDRGIGRLNAALRIYRDTILPEAQNPERQILYWIDHSRDILTDQFRCFALMDDGEVGGYLQYSYFGEEHIFFFEYLCIRSEAKSGLGANPALTSIREYLAENYRPDFCVVFEIAQKRDKLGRWQPDKKLISYFKRLGFRTIDFEYHYPILQTYDGEMSYPADLMVALPKGEVLVDAQRLRTILRCIYFKHYLRWDRPFLNTERFAKREKLINELYSREVSRIGEHDKFDTDGHGKSTFLRRFIQHSPSIKLLLEQIFAPKLPRLLVAMVILILVQWLLGSVLLLVPFVLTVAAVFCLAEDTDNSRKLFQAVVNRLSLAKQRS